jgi:DNA polymerase III alpha subunit
VIVDIRKVITKAGKIMMFLKCEGFDYDFEVVVFPKDYENYKDKLDFNKIIVVSGILDLNLEFKRKSIKAQDIKVLSITDARAQAEEG